MTTEDIVIAEVEAPLTTQEQAAREQYETTIEQGLSTFFAVGEALAQIRDQRLYRSTHGNFEDYLRERWPQIGGRRQADRLIGAAEVVRDLGPIGLTVANEAQARELSPLTPDERRTAMQQAVEAAPNGKPTAADIKRAAETVRPPAPKATPRPLPITAPASAPPPLPTPLPSTAAQTLPPALTPLQPAPQAPTAPQPDVQSLKLLYAKEQLLAGALKVVRAEIEAREDLHRYSIVFSGDRITDAVRVFLNNPSVSGAAAMLAFAAVVEEVVRGSPVPERPGLRGVTERLDAIERWLEQNAQAATPEALKRHMPALAKLEQDLIELADVLNDETYNAIADRISDARAMIRRLSGDLA